MDEPTIESVPLREDPDRMLTYRQLARQMQVPERTVRGWVASGTGPRVVAVGRYRRFRAGDVLDWLETRYVEKSA